MAFCVPVLLTVPGFLALLASVRSTPSTQVVVKSDRPDRPKWWDQIGWWWNHPYDGRVCIKGRKETLKGTQGMLTAAKDSKASAAVDSQASAAVAPAGFASAATAESVPTLGKWISPSKQPNAI